MMLSILFFISILQVCVDIKNRTPFILFTLATFFVISFPHIFITKAGVDTPLYVYNEATIYIVLFQCVYLIFSVAFSNKLICDSWKCFDGVEVPNKHVILLMLINFISVLLFIYGISKFNLIYLIYADWWSVVHSQSSLTLLASYFSYASSSLAMVIMLSTQKRVLSIFYCLLFILFTVFILKTRGYLVTFLIPVLLYYLYSMKFNKISKVKNVLLALVVILSLFIFTRMIRHGGDISNLLNMTSDDFLMLFDSATADGSEFMLIKSFYMFVQIGIEQLPIEFGRFDSLRRILFFFLPTGLFELKPIEFSYIMHNLYYGSSAGDGLSLHPTIIGEAFANGGLLGILIYPALIVLLFVTINTKLLKRNNSYMYIGPVCTLCLFLSRGAVYNGFVFFVGSCLILLILSKLSKLKF